MLAVAVTFSIGSALMLQNVEAKGKKKTVYVVTQVKSVTEQKRAENSKFKFNYTAKYNAKGKAIETTEKNDYGVYFEKKYYYNKAGDIDYTASTNKNDQERGIDRSEYKYENGKPDAAFLVIIFHIRQ